MAFVRSRLCVAPKVCTRNQTVENIINKCYSRMHRTLIEPGPRPSRWRKWSDFFVPSLELFLFLSSLG